jgi:hypothetical protein
MRARCRRLATSWAELSNCRVRIAGVIEETARAPIKDAAVMASPAAIVLNPLFDFILDPLLIGLDIASTFVQSIALSHFLQHDSGHFGDHFISSTCGLRLESECSEIEQLFVFHAFGKRPSYRKTIYRGATLSAITRGHPSSIWYKMGTGKGYWCVSAPPPKTGYWCMTSCTDTEDCELEHFVTRRVGRRRPRLCKRKQIQLSADWNAYCL